MPLITCVHFLAAELMCRFLLLYFSLRSSLIMSSSARSKGRPQYEKSDSPIPTTTKLPAFQRRSSSSWCRNFNILCHFPLHIRIHHPVQLVLIPCPKEPPLSERHFRVLAASSSTQGFARRWIVEQATLLLLDSGQAPSDRRDVST